MCSSYGRAFPPRLSTWVVVLCVFGCVGQLAAQPFSSRKTVNTADVSDGRAVVAGLLDGDDLPDIIGVSKGDGKVSYYLNEGGTPVTFGAQNVIVNKGAGGRGIALGDIDGDGDLDAVAGFDDSAPDEVKAIYWYENDLDDGLAPAFNVETEIVTDVDCAWLILEDIDNDGDLDVVAALRKDNDAAWFANPRIGANATWTRMDVNADGVGFAFFVAAGDLDNDGDKDVATAGFSNNELVWNRNGDFLGGTPGDFGSEKVIQSPLAGASAVQLVDWNNDGDVDVIGTGDTADEVNAYASSGGSGGAVITWTKTTIASLADADAVEGATGLFAADVSGNTYADVVVASRFSNSVVYIPNDTGTWGVAETLDSTLTGARAAYAHDLDNDGDLDVLSAATGVSGGGFFWYENERPTGCPESGDADFEDTQCTSLTNTVAPDGNEEGDFTFVAVGTDGTLDTVLYRFEAVLQGGGTLVRGSMASDTAVFSLTPGDWDVSVTVDDDGTCGDAAGDNTCTLATITVVPDCPADGDVDFEDTVCTDFSITVEPGANLEGSYTVTATATDTSGDTPTYIFVADRDNGAETLEAFPSTTDNATFDLGPGDWQLTCVVDDNLLCMDDLPSATCTPITRHICPTAGDTHCETITLASEPGGAIEGEYGFDANAIDDDGDTVLIYTFTAVKNLGEETLVVGPQNEDVALFNFTIGSWVVTVLVDDDSACEDVGFVNSCSMTVDVTAPACPPEGDTHCDSFVLSTDPGGIPGTYTFDATSTDDGGDTPVTYNYQAVRDGGAETLSDSNTDGSVDFDLTPGSWEISAMVDDDPDCGDVAVDATCTPLTVLVCPASGDTSCDTLERTAGPTDPNGINPGVHTFTSSGTDDGGDSPLIYDYTANRDDGAEILTSGPTNANSFDFDLTASGSWVITVVIDDDANCDDSLENNSCSTTIDVFDPCPVDGDSHCTSIAQEDGPGGNSAGAYTFRVSATDDSADQIEVNATVSSTGGESILVSNGVVDAAHDIVVSLTDGEYTVNANVDDDAVCLDEADDVNCTPLVVTVSSLAPERGLQGFFDFEDSGDLGADAHIGLFNGSNTGVTSGSLRGDSGTGDFGTTADSFRIDLPEDVRFIPQTPFTVAAFIKMSTADGPATIYGENQAGPTTLLFQVLGMSDGDDIGLPRLYTEGGGVSASVLGTTRVDDGEWHHVAGVIRDDGSLAMYVGGLLEGSTAGPIGNLTALFGDSFGAAIGTIKGDGSDHFGGQMDEVRVYNVELTLEEVQEISHYCPPEGDTHCGGISVAAPADNVPGAYTIEATGTDDSSDDVLYSFQAVQGDTMLVDGPTTSSSVTFSLTEGAWDLTVSVDDDLDCEDTADDSTCTSTVTVCPASGDTHCDGVAVTAPAENAPGTYTVEASATDDSGDDVLYSFQAVQGALVLIEGPTNSSTASFSLTEGTWDITVSVDDDANCTDVAGDATCTVSVDVCPAEGDTHCDDISITAPADNAPGTYSIEASATDDSGDTVLYTYQAVQEGTVLTDGPTASSTASFSLTEGAWDITVSVDDDVECGDVAQDATRTTSVDVCPGTGDTHCTGVQLSGPAQADGQNVPGTYTATASSSDDSGDAVMHTFTADNGVDAPIVVGPQEESSTEFNLDPGAWTISVSVDDESCADVASDATCEASIEISDVGVQLPGDINGDGDKDLSDAIALARFLFVDPDARLACGNGLRDDPANSELFDWNGDSTINLADVVSTLDWLFKGGPSHAAGDACLAKPGCPDTDPCPAQ